MILNSVDWFRAHPGFWNKESFKPVAQQAQSLDWSFKQTFANNFSVLVVGDLVDSLRKGAASQAGVERSILEKLVKRYFLSLGRALEEPKTAEPAEQSAGLFWARLLPYQCIVEPGKEQEFTLLIRNNFDEVKGFRAKVLAPEQ